MNVKERLKRQLVATRQMSDRMLADFQTPADWVYQVHPNCNHALWFVGHMASTDNFMISLIAPDQSRQIEGLAERFGMGSQPTNNAAAYPPAEEVLADMHERRAKLLEVLDGLSEEDLSKSTPKGAPDFLPDFASVFEMAIWHEGIHSGQLTVTRRSSRPQADSRGELNGCFLHNVQAVGYVAGEIGLTAADFERHHARFGLIGDDRSGGS